MACNLPIVQPPITVLHAAIPQDFVPMQGASYIGLPTHLDHFFALDLDAASSVKTTYDTLTQDQSSGIEDRISKRLLPRREIELGENRLTPNETEYLHGIFRIVRGSTLGFLYDDPNTPLEAPQAIARFNNEFTLDLAAPYPCGGYYHTSNGIKLTAPLKQGDAIAQITTLRCHGLLIQKRDGTILGFTDHDQSLYLNNTHTLLLKPGLTSFAVEQSVDFSVDNSEATVALDSVSDAIWSNIEVLKKQFDGARCRLFTIERAAVSTTTGEVYHTSVLLDGFLGDIQLEQTQVKIELRAFVQLLQQKNTLKTTKLCRHRFGDGKCRKNLTSLQVTATVNSVQNLTRFSVSATYITGDLDAGTVEFLTGVNAGLAVNISKNFGSSVILWEPLPLLPSVGDSVRVTKGCNKTFEQCRLYNNATNFGAFPHTPGSDAMIGGANKAKRD